jgi:3-hydroxyisobutyrate dehydrogenase
MGMPPSNLLRSVRAYGSIGHDVARLKTVGFVGLGRMGSEMAFNLFSKRLTDAHDSQFVVCDALPESARSFCDSFLAQFPAAHVRAVLTPGE